MAALTGNSISSSYLGLLKTTDNAALTGTLKQLTDGAGNNLTLQASTTGMSFSGNIDFSAATVTGLPSGGGGGLVLATGNTDSLRSALTSTEASIGAGADRGVAIGQGASIAANRDNSVAIGNGAAANQSSAVVIGSGAQTASSAGVALGQFANASGSTQATSIGYFARSETTQSVAIGGNTRSWGDRACSIGANAQAGASSAVAIGNGANLGNTQFANASIIGSFNASPANSFQSGFIASADGGSFPSGYQANDLVAIGRGISWGGSGCNNTIVMGLVASASNAQDAVGIGRQINISGNSTTAIGRNSQATASNATAIGAYAQATANNAVAIGNNVTGAKADTCSVNKLELVATGGSIIMKSPNGTEYTITVTDAGVLTVS